MTRGAYLAYYALMAVACISVVAQTAAANLAPIPPGNGFYSVGGGLAYIFLVNLPFDILLLSTTVLLVWWYWGNRVGVLVKDSERFTASFVAGGVLVAVAGAFIDFYLLFTEYTGTHPTLVGTYWFDFDPVTASVAAALVGLSVYAVCYAMLRIDKFVSSIPAVIIGLANYISWSALTDGYGLVFDSASIPIVMFLAFLVVPVPVYIAWSWHKKRVTAC